MGTLSPTRQAKHFTSTRWVGGRRKTSRVNQWDMGTHVTSLILAKLQVLNTCTDRQTEMFFFFLSIAPQPTRKQKILPINKQTTSHKDLSRKTTNTNSECHWHLQGRKLDEKPGRERERWRRKRTPIQSKQMWPISSKAKNTQPRECTKHATSE